MEVANIILWMIILWQNGGLDVNYKEPKLKISGKM